MNYNACYGGGAVIHDGFETSRSAGLAEGGGPLVGRPAVSSAASEAETKRVRDSLRKQLKHKAGPPPHIGPAICPRVERDRPRCQLCLPPPPPLRYERNDFSSPGLPVMDGTCHLQRRTRGHRSSVFCELAAHVRTCVRALPTLGAVLAAIFGVFLAMCKR